MEFDIKDRDWLKMGPKKNWRWVDKTYALKETSYLGVQTTHLDFIADDHGILWRDNGEFGNLKPALPSYDRLMGGNGTEPAPKINEFISVIKTLTC